VEVKEEVEKPNPFWVMVFVRALSQFLYTIECSTTKKGCCCNFGAQHYHFA
jgi:hypothetical protein